MIQNYTHIGFKPGNSLQSSELNEIQERFYLDQTLNSILIGNWLIFTSSYYSVTGNEQDQYLGLKTNGAIPSDPKQVEVYYTDQNVVITLNTGWYRINHSTTHNLSTWVFLENPVTESLPFFSDNGLYVVTLDLNISEIEASPNEDDEGYSLNSNVSGFIEPWIQGSDRIKIKINGIKILRPFEQEINDIAIVKLRKGIDYVSSYAFLVQYMNNFKIKQINIS